MQSTYCSIELKLNDLNYISAHLDSDIMLEFVSCDVLLFSLSNI